MSKLLCQPCRDDGEKVEAFGFCLDCCDYLCEDCHKNHRKPRPTRNHNLLDKEQMLKDLDTLPTKDSAVEICKKHSESVKYFCPDHDTVGCSVCVTIEHKTCEDIVHVPQAAEGILDSDEYKRLEQEISDTTTRFENIIPSAKENISKSGASNTKVADEISTYMDAIIATIKKLEDAVRTDANQCHQEDVKKMNSIISKSKEALDKLKFMKTNMYNLLKMKQHNKLFITMKVNSRELRNMQAEMVEWEDDNNVRVSRFYGNAVLRKFLTSVDRLGDIAHAIRCHEDSVENSSTEIHELSENEDSHHLGIEAKFYKDVDIRTQSEKRVFCNAEQLAVLEGDRVMVVSPAGNAITRVTLVDIKCDRILSELLIPGGLCRGIAKIDDSHVVLSLDGSRNTLVKINPTVRVHKQLGDSIGHIAPLNKEIFVSTGSTTIVKFGMVGKESSIVDLSTIGKERQNIYASALYEQNHQLKVYSIVRHIKQIKVEEDGHMKWVDAYGRKKWAFSGSQYLGHGVFGDWVTDKVDLPVVPETITMSEDGKLLFVLAGDVIYVVRAGSTDAHVLLGEKDGLYRVSAMAFCSKSRQLVVAIKNCNFINVYKVSGTW